MTITCKKCLFLIAALIFQLHHLRAQTPTDTLQIRNIAQNQGLSQLNALSLDLDSLGYLWVGTENGLNRYNGKEMAVFKAGKDTDQLSDDHIRDMYFANDTLWLATNTHAISAYLPRQNRFISFEDSLDLAENPEAKFTYTIYPVDNRHLIVGTIGHCIIVDRKGPTFKILKLPKQSDAQFVTTITSLDEDNFLIGTNSNQSYLLEFSSLSITPFFNNELLIHSFLKTSEQEVWLGTETGLFSFNPQSQETSKILMPEGEQEVRRLFQWDKKHIWVACVNKNYLVDQNDNWQEIIFTNSIGKPLQSTVLAMKKDDQGGIWMGTEGRGVFYHHDKQKKFIANRIQAENAPKKDFISLFNFLKEGDTLWMATEFGIARYLTEEKTYKLYLTGALDYTLAKDARGGLWAGGFGDGLLRYDRKKDTFKNIPLDINDNEVIQITPVSTDSLWIHTWSEGIYSFHIENQGIKKKIINGSSLFRARNSFISSNGDIWLASDGGLFQITKDGEEFHYDSLSNERVFAIDEDPFGNIWAGTAKGLNKISNGNITTFTEQEGLPNDFIYGLESDGKGNIWVSTNYGISVLDPETETFKNFTEQDGLQNNEFNGKASYKDKAGYLYFGGMNGFNIFHPDSIPINKKVGNTIVESIELFGKPIDKQTAYQKELTFSHDQNVITFNYITLSFLWPEKNHYQFMLEGFDQEWRPVTKERSTTYTNLDPGTYTFKVKATNNEMIWGEIQELNIVIKSPWYSTTGFKILAILSLVMLVFAIILIRDKRQKNLTKKLSTMVEERTRDLIQSNQALNESLEITNQQKENISFLMRELNHRVKNNLQLITSLIDFQNINNSNPEENNKLQQLKSRIFTVARVHDLLSQDRLIDVDVDQFISHLSHELLDISGTDIEVKLEIENLTFPSHQLTYLGLVLNELITNSIKHAFDPVSQSKKITIQLFQEDQKVKIIYQDNGKGFSEDQTRKKDSMGLQLMEILTQEMNGSFDSKSDKGAKFIFTFNITSEKHFELTDDQSNQPTS